MAQNPLVAFVSKIVGSNALAAQAVNGAGEVYNTNGGQQKFQVSAIGVDPIVPALFCAHKLVVLVAGSGNNFTLNDAASLAAANTANEIFTIAANSTAWFAGAVFTIEVPLTSGSLAISSIPAGALVLVTVA